MNVKELIEYLKTVDQDLPVYKSYGSGDYWGSVVANEIEEVTEMDLVYSEYHQKMSVPTDNDETYDKKTIQAIVL